MCALVPEYSLAFLVKTGDEVTYKAAIPNFIYAPEEKSKICGKLLVYINGETYGEIPLITKNDIPLDEAQRLNTSKLILRKILLLFRE